MKNFIFGFLIAIIFGAVAFYSYQMGQEQTLPLPSPTSNPTVTSEIKPTDQVVGGDKDEHGCIGSAGYSWCQTKNKCLRIWEEPCIGANDTEEITQALIEKHPTWTADSIIVTINKNDGQYAGGGVKEKNAEVGGGYFFAVKDQGKWKIIADGNGTIDCAVLIPYPDYPTSLIPECFDMNTGKPVTR